MPFQPVLSPDLRLVPPLDLPLRFRHANGQFGALRPKPLPEAPLCFSRQVIPATDPANPSGEDVSYLNQIHEAIDLSADAGDCVYAAYAGRVVEVNLAPGRGNITIDHHSTGKGLLSRYLHIRDVRFAVGDFVQKGTPIASVSDGPDEPHLHFELWVTVDDSGSSAPEDTDLAPVDPTRLLYRWEETVTDTDVDVRPTLIEGLGLTRISAMPFFALTLAGDTPLLHVPLHPPITESERLLVELARDAHGAGRSVQARYRPSAFWGVDVLTELALV